MCHDTLFNILIGIFFLSCRTSVKELMDHVSLSITDEGKDMSTADVSNPFQPAQAETPKSGAEKCFTSITDKLSKLSSDHILSYGTVCIYRIPEKHRKKNEEAYTPRLVSIGLVHHGESQLQTMQQYKLKYLHNFLHTFQVSLEKLVKYVDSREKLVCGCYEDIYIRNLPKKFEETPTEVILLDGIFVIELFLKNHFPEMRENGDVIFDNPWVTNEILHDLILFENQLPFEFLFTLYEDFVISNTRKWLHDDIIYFPSFIELAHKYFKNVGNTGLLPLKRDFRKARHLVEFLSILHMPGDSEMSRRVEQKVEKKFGFAKCATAVELQAAGVKFQKGTGICLLDVHFDNEAGVLTIPALTVNDSTETFLRNVIAFEQSGYHSKCITSWVVLLDNLIDTAQDVDLLIRHEIIRNELSSSEEVATLFNNLYKEHVADPKEFYFVQECRELNEYSRDWWHKYFVAKFTKWYVMLKRDYFGSPWSLISVIAALIALGLTAMQAAYAARQDKKH